MMLRKREVPRNLEKNADDRSERERGEREKRRVIVRL